MIRRSLIRFILFGILGLVFQSVEISAFTQPPTLNLMRASAMAGCSFETTTRRNMAGGPAVLDKPETVEKVAEDKVTQKDEELGRDGWEIRLFNDPFNKREFVARCLATICGKSDTESYQIMMQAHNNGMGVVGRYMYEIAELYYKSLQENGLLVDMVPVDDE